MSFYNNVNVLLYGSDNQGTLAPTRDRAKVFTVPPVVVSGIKFCSVRPDIVKIGMAPGTDLVGGPCRSWSVPLSFES